MGFRKLRLWPPVPSLQIDEETETVTDFIFCYTVIFLEVFRPLQTLFIDLKVHLVKAVVFPVVLYGCESWTIKKAENQRIDAFEL